MKRILHAIAALCLTAALTGCTLVKVNIVDEAQPLTERTLSGEGRDKVLLLDISGFISNREDPSPLGAKKRTGLVARVREELDRARKDGRVKAVVLRINSPGGGVTASDMLYHELKKFKQESGAKLVAHFLDAGTSGAYYAALAADRITAQPTSITGSIGVILFRVDATGLMQKVGIQSVEIASGERKGMGSPFRPLAPEEQEIFRDMVHSMKTRFVTIVSEERKMAREAADNLADGRIFTSGEALNAGLIDGIGYLDDAIDQAKKLAGLERASVVTYFRPGEYRPNLYSLSLFNLDLGEMLQPGLSFLYVWWP